MNNDGHDAGKSEKAATDARIASKREEALNFKTLLERFYLGHSSAESDGEQKVGSPGTELEFAL